MTQVCLNVKCHEIFGSVWNSLEYNLLASFIIAIEKDPKMYHSIFSVLNNFIDRQDVKLIYEIVDLLI